MFPKAPMLFTPSKEFSSLPLLEHYSRRRDIRSDFELKILLISSREGTGLSITNDLPSPSVERQASSCILDCAKNARKRRGIGRVTPVF